MKTDERTKYISEVETTGDAVGHPPFKVEESNKRRFVRLQISAPMSLTTLKEAKGKYLHKDNPHMIEGCILNISAGGVLVDLNEAVSEQDIVALHFTLQNTESLNDVLGLVKRVDISPEGCLTGVEFISREQLKDFFGAGELDLLPEQYSHFDEGVRQLLNRYVVSERECENE